MLSLLKQEAFLTPLLGKGHLGDLLSAGSLPILYLAVGLKVGSEMAGLMSNMLHEQEQPDV
jgi:multicomponent Na+:H+ antiporter subunit B